MVRVFSPLIIGLRPFSWNAVPPPTMQDNQHISPSDTAMSEGRFLGWVVLVTWWLPASYYSSSNWSRLQDVYWYALMRPPPIVCASRASDSQCDGTIRRILNGSPVKQDWSKCCCMCSEIIGNPWGFFLWIPNAYHSWINAMYPTDASRSPLYGFANQMGVWIGTSAGRDE